MHLRILIVVFSGFLIAETTFSAYRVAQFSQSTRGGMELQKSTRAFDLISIQTLPKLHPKEKHFLVMNQQKTDFEVFVSFKEVLKRKISWNDLWVNK